MRDGGEQQVCRRSVLLLALILPIGLSFSQSPRVCLETATSKTKLEQIGESEKHRDSGLKNIETKGVAECSVIADGIRKAKCFGAPENGKQMIIEAHQQRASITLACR